MYTASNDYEVHLCNSMEDMVAWVQAKDAECGLSRMIAGYSWKWSSKSEPTAYDIEIDNVSLRWNNTATAWIHSPGAVSEVGCIHTTQGYDLNNAAVIVGNEIGYDKKKGEIIINEDQYFDKNGKHSTANREELKSYILNIYKTILLRGIRGTCLYVCNEDLRELFSKSLPVLGTRKDEQLPVTNPSPRVLPFAQVVPWGNSIPLYDLRVAAGEFGAPEQIQDIQWVEVRSPRKNQFACTVVGNSMNKLIPDGSLCLFEKYEGGTRNGRIVLVELTDFHDPDCGSRYTVKEYSSIKAKNGSHGSWSHSSITLKVRTTDSSCKDIELNEDAMTRFRVIAVFKEILWRGDSGQLI